MQQSDEGPVLQVPLLLLWKRISQRQEELAKPKRVISTNEDRPSPLWPVSSSALLAVPSARVGQLAEPKRVNQEWREDRTAYSKVSEGAKKATATSRVIQLAQPKNKDSFSLPVTPSNHRKAEDKYSRATRSAPSEGPKLWHVR
ncbi:hypothetical protein GDO86_018983 [Hymenochirus boettgeri]|uniref:Uncharacterized protein n=1 Tax=Hymenochirus boettgeri TaxID=247094 RepID=A0A8T2IFD6_9PIPI|nr:hypothetical protein GDO86_018983 [Hymenochirus boettgeri]